MNNEQVTLLKNYLKIADASEIEVKACLEVARRYRLDPFKQGQIWFIKRWDRNASALNGSKGAYVYTPQTGIYGLLHIAGRDYPDFGSMSEAEFGPMFTHDVEGHKFKAPEWCRVKAFKKGIAEPTVATIYFEEFCPSAWDNARLFWARMPRAQIEKCAKARALRTAYPDLGGLYIPEEMDRMADEYTASGRQIIPNVPASGSHEAAQQVAREKIAAAASGKPIQHEIVVSAQSESKPDPSWPTITIDFRASLTSPVVTGDADLFKPLFDAHCKWESDGFWHTDQRGALAIDALASQMRFKLVTIMPKQVPSEGKGAQGKAAPASAQTKAPSQNQRKETKTNTSQAAAAGGTVSAGEPLLVKGTIQHFTEKMTKGSAKNPSAPYLNVLLKTEHGDRWYSTFDRDLFEYISKAKGKSGEFIVKQSGDFWNLLGFKTLAGRQFEDGKVLVVNRDREAGSAGTLFQP